MKINMDFIREPSSKLNNRDKIKRLKDIVINSQDHKHRIDALKNLKSFDLKNNYDFFENLFLTDESQEVQLIAGEILLEKYSNNSKIIDVMEYCLYKIEKIYHKLIALDILLKIDNKRTQKIIKNYYMQFSEALLEIKFKSKNIPNRIQLTNLILYGYYRNQMGYNVTFKDGYIILLNCEGTKLRKISSIVGLKYLNRLEYLKLRRTSLSKINGLLGIKSLKILDLSNNSIEKLDNLEELSNLEEFYVDNNNIKRIENLSSLSNLRKISLVNNKIRKIEGLSALSKLEELNLNNNLISEIENLENLGKLRNLNLSYNSISDIENLEKLENLSRLYLNNNNIREIKGLDTLIQLKGLYLSENQIEKIENLSHLIELRKLELSNNKIEELQGLHNLMKLQELFLDNNKIDVIKGISNLKSLIILFLKGNRIKEFKSEDVQDLPNLNFIFLNDNPLTPESRICYNKRTRYP
jgi:hypothetical protein